MSFLPDLDFRRVVQRYDGDSRFRGFSCWGQLLAMAFAQLAYLESLREIEVFREFSAGVRKLEAVALGYPVMPVSDGLVG